MEGRKDQSGGSPGSLPTAVTTKDADDADEDRPVNGTANGGPAGGSGSATRDSAVRDTVPDGGVRDDAAQAGSAAGSATRNGAAGKGAIGNGSSGKGTAANRTGANSAAKGAANGGAARGGSSNGGSASKRGTAKGSTPSADEDVPALPADDIGQARGRTKKPDPSGAAGVTDSDTVIFPSVGKPSGGKPATTDRTTVVTSAAGDSGRRPGSEPGGSVAPDEAQTIITDAARDDMQAAENTGTDRDWFAGTQAGHAAEVDTTMLPALGATASGHTADPAVTPASSGDTSFGQNVWEKEESFGQSGWGKPSTSGSGTSGSGTSGSAAASSGAASAGISSGTSAPGLSPWERAETAQSGWGATRSSGSESAGASAMSSSAGSSPVGSASEQESTRRPDVAVDGAGAASPAPPYAFPRGSLNLGATSSDTAAKPARGEAAEGGARPGLTSDGGADTLAGPSLKGLKGSRKTARQAHLTVARIEPWSVMKFSFVVSLVAFVILFVAVAVLYGVLAGLGVFNSLQHLVTSLTSSQGSQGTSVSSVLSASRVLGYTALLGALNVVLITAMSTIGSVIYNLTSRLVGGVEVTLRETE